jgi:hypothetical protein
MNGKQQYIDARIESLQREQGYTFQRAFEEVLASSPDVMDGTVKGGFARTPPKKEGRHPAVIEEMSKHWQLEQSRKKWGEVAHANRLGRIRELMQQNGWNFDQAFTEAMREEAQTQQTPTSAAHETEPDKQLALVQGSHWDWTREQCEDFCWQTFWS